MKKFYVFSYQSHDSAGGLNDLIGDFDTLEAAEAAIVLLRDENAHVGAIDDEGHLSMVRDYWYTNYLINEQGEFYHDRTGKQQRRWIESGSVPVRELNTETEGGAQ